MGQLVERAIMNKLNLESSNFLAFIQTGLMTENETQMTPTVLASNVILDLKDGRKEENIEHCLFHISLYERIKNYWSVFLAASLHSPLQVAEMSVLPKTS